MPNENLSPNLSPVDADPNPKIAPRRVASSKSGVSAQPIPVSKRKRGRFWKGLGVFLLAGTGVAYGYFNHTEQGVEQWNFVKTMGPVILEAQQNPNKIFDEVGTDHFNILLVGRDVNYKNTKVYDPTTKTYRPFHVVDPDTPARSDTMIVMSLDKSNGSIRMISLPRDAKVHLPPNKYHERTAKLNAAHAFGGVDLLKQTLHDELGLTIHRYAVIKFEGFKKLIDEVGGIYVDVIGPVTRDGRRKDLIYDDNWGNLHIHLKPGKQMLNGQQAHDYVRYRMDMEGDASRIRRQQSVMRALAHALKDMPMTKVPSIVKEIRQRFETDMSDSELASAGLFAKNGSQETKIQPVTMFGVWSKRGSLTLNRPKNELLMRAIFGSTFNPKHFLENSPSTDEDEIGLENNSSPEAQDLLREAGIIKGSRIAANSETSDAANRDQIDPNPAITDGASDPATQSSLTPDASLPTSPETSAPGEAAPATSSEVDPNSASRRSDSSSSRDKATPRRRRLRRRQSSEETTSTEAHRSEVANNEERPRRRRRRSKRSEEASSSRGEARVTHDLNVESPIPQPEDNTPAADSESPIPRPE